MKILTPIQNDCYLACSGGIDSMFALHFLRMGRKNVQPLFFNHGTETSNLAEQFLLRNVPNIIIGRIAKIRGKGESPEKFLRDERYNFFSQFTDKPIITCHHLNDCAENWIMTALKGTPKLIPYKNKNIVRPFLLVSKNQIIDYCMRKNVNWIEDKTNIDLNIPRNRIRHKVLPELLLTNPGFFRMLRKKIQESFL